MAGIHFMATGGIGGVHRGWEHSLDISADLTEAGRTEVCIVCSGAKSLLDIPATLEMLETRGIPIIGYRTDTFPLFYVTAQRATRWPTAPTTPRPIAAAAAAHWGFARRTGILVVQPVAEEVALDADETEALVEEALAEATPPGVTGPGGHARGCSHACTPPPAAARSPPTGACWSTTPASPPRSPPPTTRLTVGQPPAARRRAGSGTRPRRRIGEAPAARAAHAVDVEHRARVHERRYGTCPEGRRVDARLEHADHAADAHALDHQHLAHAEPAQERGAPGGVLEEPVRLEHRRRTVCSIAGRR